MHQSVIKIIFDKFSNDSLLSPTFYFDKMTVISGDIFVSATQVAV